jgi:glycosidase
MTLISTVRGIPQLYYGSEVGMRGDKNKGAMQISEEIFRAAGNQIRSMLSILRLRLLNKKNFTILPRSC